MLHQAASDQDQHDPLSIEIVSDGDALAFVKTLFVEYAEAFDHALCFEGFDRELELLPAPYSAPKGALLLARIDGRPAGCVALTPVKPKTVEIKRLFVRPAYRGHGLGRRLTKAAMDQARRMQYRKLTLETVPATMAVAEVVYRELGFTRDEDERSEIGGDIVRYHLALK